MYQQWHIVRRLRVDRTFARSDTAPMQKIASYPSPQKRALMRRSCATAYWGAGVTLAVHGLLALAFLHPVQNPSLVPHAPGPALDVTLVAAPVYPHTLGPEQALALTSAAEPVLIAVPLRDELHYYFPHELDRQLIVLRDHSGDADIALHEAVVMHLFVDVVGKVAAIVFDGELPGAQQEQLRAAFMSMEFLPGMKQGNAVPSRLKIVISAILAPPAGGSEVLQD